MKGSKITIALIVLVFSYSCKKDDVSGVKNTRPMYVGIYDSSFYHHEFVTPLYLSIAWDSLNLYGFGSDSLDVNNDGEIDVTFNLSLLNEDSLHLITGYPDPFPNLSLVQQSQFEILTYSEYTYTGLGSGLTFYFVKDLIYGEKVDAATEFYNQQHYYDLWYENPSTIGPSFGNLYYINSISYIAFRLNGNKFGWIKVDMTDNKNPAFLSFAVQL